MNFGLKKYKKAGVLAMPDRCVGCENEFSFGNWRFRHGDAACAHCGMTYHILEYEDDDKTAPRCVTADEWVEAISDFYEEHSERWDQSDEWEQWAKLNYPELLN